MNAATPHLRFRPLWLLTGYVLIAIIIYLSLTSTPPDVGPEILYKDKFFHALAYFAVMGWFVQIYHTALQRNLWAMFFVSMGVALEYLQSFDPAREGGVSDAVANTAGVLLALLLARTAFKNILIRLESLL